MMGRHLHSVGYPGTLEGRVFDVLAERAGVELAELCATLRYLACESVQGALERLRKRGSVAMVPAGRTTFWCVVRGAQRPQDRRGRMKATQQVAQAA